MIVYLRFCKMVRYGLIGLLLLVVSGCAVTPKPLTATEVKAQAELDRSNVTRHQEFVTGPISLHEAIARALKYNLNYRVEFARKLFAETELDLSHYDLLPEVVARAGYNSRDKFSGSRSRRLAAGGTVGDAASTSSERDIFTSDLSLTWNILDFGLSYVRAQQAADRVLIADEEKRRVINRVVQDVRSVYWRAVTNDRIMSKVQELLGWVSDALEQSKQVELKRLDSPLSALTYQLELINVKQELEALRRDLSFAKVQLGSLMNLSPDQDYHLVIPDRTEVLGKVDMSPAMMELLALENRPELRILSYERRIGAQQARAAILELLPGIDISFGKNYTSNSFVFNRNWLSYGSQVSWNLLNVFKLPAVNRSLDAQSDLLDVRGLALSMAVMTQVHVSLAQYEYAHLEHKTAADYYETQDKILTQLELSFSKDTVSRQSLLREQMNMLLAEVRYDLAYAEVENAYGNLFVALGTDPFPADVDTQQDVQSLSETILNYLEGLSSGHKLFSMTVQ